MSAFRRATWTPDLSNWTPAAPASSHGDERAAMSTLEPLETCAHYGGACGQAQSDPETWRYIPVGPFGSTRPSSGRLGRKACASSRRPHAVRRPHGKRPCLAARSSLHADHPRPPELIEVGYIVFTPAPATHPRIDRGDLSDNQVGLRSRLPPLRMEMQRRQPGLASRRPKVRLVLRGHLPASRCRERKKSGYGLVCSHRFRVARVARSL